MSDRWGLDEWLIVCRSRLMPAALTLLVNNGEGNFGASVRKTLMRFPWQTEERLYGIADMDMIPPTEVSSSNIL